MVSDLHKDLRNIIAGVTNCKIVLSDQCFYYLSLSLESMREKEWKAPNISANKMEVPA